MRYRLMATYRGVPYEAGVGPADSDIMLFAACPPPEDLGFLPATGHWRKSVNRAEVDVVWESRPSGTFGDEPCLVLDDLGDQLHIGYLGHDPIQAERLGYCEVEPGVFEVLVAREEVTGITEERVDSPYPPAPTWSIPVPAPVSAPVAPLEPPPSLAQPTRRRRGNGGRPSRAQTRQTFSDLIDLAAIPQDAYAVDAEVDGAICLTQGADGGFEVFIAVDGTRQEVRSFRDEEAAYFYMFGLLAAEAVRDGRLMPPPSESARPRA
jgi:hypothetical protein